MPAFKIHPSIGVARLGDSPTEFYLSPDEAGVLPIECTPDGRPVVGPDGKEQRITRFKDAQNRIKRQAARFRLHIYDEAEPKGRELKLGEQFTFANEHSGQKMLVEVLDIVWTVYLANKKAVWYEFKQTDGEHGYADDHPLRNAGITDPTVRQHLIIDPGPQTLNTDPKKVQSAEFARGQNPNAAQSFPPPLQPHSIDTLGGIKVYADNGCSRLIVLGGFGNAGSSVEGLGQPSIQDYANNDGWFDDTSDGPVTARIKYKILKIDGRNPINPPRPQYLIVEDSAWCIVGYPRYAPQIVDIITMDDLVFDVAVRQFAYRPEIFGDGKAPPAPGDAAALATWRNFATWNREYRPYFWRDIWPIVSRPQYYNNITDPGAMFGGDPHNATRGSGGQLDPDQLSRPPYAGEDPAAARSRAGQRAFVYGILRKPKDENDFRIVPNPQNGRQFIGMPYLCGDNPISNTSPSKFLRLTDTQLFFMRQWAEGKFINERDEEIDTSLPPGEALDRGALATMLGGAFCPGAEACWIMRNPAIYAKAFRLKLSNAYKPVASFRNPIPGSLSITGNLATGLEPGDITKYGAVPWQADFNECSTQDVNITYRDWNETPLASIGDPALQVIQTTYWWPSHRPMFVNGAFWSNGVPQTNDGDLAMVTAWARLGFITLDDPSLGGGSAITLVEAQNQ